TPSASPACKGNDLMGEAPQLGRSQHGTAFAFSRPRTFWQHDPTGLVAVTGPVLGVASTPVTCAHTCLRGMPLRR
ncbi:MAG: hypothetical protein KBI47_23625, partial [Armatimonadetes bacterium]|nr:hypothetical protein [Armatimonadota bacterium]